MEGVDGLSSLLGALKFHHGTALHSSMGAADFCMSGVTRVQVRAFSPVAVAQMYCGSTMQAERRNCTFDLPSLPPSRSTSTWTTAICSGVSQTALRKFQL